MARFGYHAFGHFLLDHDDDALDGKLLFQELHDDRRRDIVGQIGTDREGLVIHDFFDVDAQDVAVDDAHVVIVFQGLVEDGQQMVVQFDSRDGCARFGQGLGQGADARPDFQDRIALPDFGSVGNVVDDGVTDEEILAQLLIHAQAKAFDDVADDVGIGQVDFFHLFHLVDLTEGIIPFVTGDAVMVQAFQKLFGIAIADTQDSADFGPAVGRIRRPVEAGSGNVLHGKGRLRFIRRTADFGQGQADDFRRGKDGSAADGCVLPDHRDPSG